VSAAQTALALLLAAADPKAQLDALKAHRAAEEAAADRRLEAVQAELRPRLAARARMGRAGELRVLAASPSFGDLVKRRFLLDRILAHDAQVIRAASGARAERIRAREARQEESRSLQALSREAADRRALAGSRLTRRRALLVALRGQKALHERAAQEAAGQEHKLTEFLAALPPPRKGDVGLRGFGALRGRLPRPAEATVEVPFGKVVHPRFKTVTVQNGVELKAPAGAEVRAVAPGRVVHAGWFRGYGNLVIVDHGEGFHTLVAHLASMHTAMGEEVQAGTLLGTVGDTGSLRGPSLYFEVRERGRPVDPRAWMVPRPGDILPR